MICKTLETSYVFYRTKLKVYVVKVTLSGTHFTLTLSSQTIRKQNLIILLVKKFFLLVSAKDQFKDETNDAVHFLPLGQVISLASIRVERII